MMLISISTGIGLQKTIQEKVSSFFGHISISNFQNNNSQLSKNPILVTALNSIIGYEKAASIAKKAYKENRPIIEVAAEETDLTKSKLEKLLDPTKLAKGGI